MTLGIVKISPTGNMTVLVKTPVPRDKHGEVARALMQTDGVGAEQVCFIEPPADPRARARMQMMGGEFCVNATISLAAYLCRVDGAKSARYVLEASGCDEPLCVDVSGEGAGYTGRAPLPGGAFVTRTDFAGITLPTVHLSGIAHAVAPDALRARFADNAADTMRSWARNVDEEAFGVLFLSGDDMRPLVYVKETDSAVWENACGSGSAAVAALRAYKSRTSAHVVLRQPGGVMQAEAAYEAGKPTRLLVTGSARIVLDGTAYI